MNVRAFGHGGFDLFVKIEELGCHVARVVLADDDAGGDGKGCKQRGRAMPDRGVGSPLGHARCHRQDGLRTVQSPDLRFFVYAEYDSLFRR